MRGSAGGVGALIALLGLVTVASTRGQAQGTIRGLAWDSVASRPLTGAIVQLLKADDPRVSRAVTAAGDGRFVLDSVGPGVWLLGVNHPAIDALGLEPPALRLRIVEAGTAEVTLGIPSAGALRRLWCGAGSDSSAAWVGVVRSATDGRALPGATLVAQWTRFVARGRIVARDEPTVSLVSGEGGAFRACGLPTDELLRAQVFAGSDTSGVLTFHLPASGVLQRDVYAGPSRLVTRRVVLDSTAADSGRVDVEFRAGSGRVRGRVVRRGDVPVSGARVRLPETGAESVTNSDGWFAMDSLPLGSWTFDAQAIGFISSSLQVDVIEGELSSPTFVLDAREQFLDTVKVTANRVLDAPWRQDFLDRQRRGFGYFLDEAQVDGRRALYVSDLVREFPSVLVSPGPFGGRILFRSTSFSQRYCSPDLFVNGTYVPAASQGESVESFVAPHQIRAVEVYTRAAEVPAPYQRSNGCGALLVWTK